MEDQAQGSVGVATDELLAGVPWLSRMMGGGLGSGNRKKPRLVERASEGRKRFEGNEGAI